LKLTIQKGSPGNADTRSSMCPHRADDPCADPAVSSRHERPRLMRDEEVGEAALVGLE
jgi:hypothetical protein